MQAKDATAGRGVAEGRAKEPEQEREREKEGESRRECDEIEFNLNCKQFVAIC